MLSLPNAVTKNLQKIRCELEALQEAVKPGETFIEFDKKRVDLCREHAEKDDKGNPVIINSEFLIKDKQTFDTNLENLRNEYYDVCNIREKQIKEYEQLLEESCELSFYKIIKEDLPENITAEQMIGIIEIVEDGD